MKEALQNLGAELAQQREAGGLTRAQLAGITKIAEPYLTRMEEGDFDFLPRVYVRAFIRSICREIGLDAEVMMRRLEEITRPVEPAATPLPEAVPEVAIAPPPPPPVRSRIAPVRALVTATAEKAGTSWFNPFTIGLALVAVTLVLFIWLTGDRPEPVQRIDSGISLAPVGSRVTPPPDTLIPINNSAGADTTTRKEMTLTVRALETAWVRIVHHDSLAEEGLFAAGEGRSWSSRGDFYLKIGNAGGILLALDGKELGPAGEKGRVANIKVNGDGISVVTFAEFPPAMGGAQP